MAAGARTMETEKGECLTLDSGATPRKIPLIVCVFHWKNLCKNLLGRYQQETSQC